MTCDGGRWVMILLPPLPPMRSSVGSGEEGWRRGQKREGGRGERKRGEVECGVAVEGVYLVLLVLLFIIIVNYCYYHHHHHHHHRSSSSSYCYYY